jgi:hypothetical protein
MATDAKLLVANETGISTTTNSTGFDLFYGGYRIPMWLRVEVTAGAASGSNVTMTFKIQHSSTNVDGNFVDHTSGADQVVTITAGGSVRDRDVVWIPLLSDKRYIRLVMTKGGGTLASGAYNAYITNSHPQ